MITKAVAEYQRKEQVGQQLAKQVPPIVVDDHPIGISKELAAYENDISFLVTVGIVDPLRIEVPAIVPHLAHKQLVEYDRIHSEELLVIRIRDIDP